MTIAFLLTSRNVFQYLTEQGLCTQKEADISKIEPKFAKNFNLLISIQDKRKLLIKQERHNTKGKTSGEFLKEWQVHEFIQRFPELSHIQTLISEVLHFNANHSIIIFNYLDNFRDLADFYAKENIFTTVIASSIASTLATVHRATFNRQEYQDFFSQNHQNYKDVPNNKGFNFASGLERITPEIFGMIPADGIKFFSLYQRYDSLGKAIAELTSSIESCCLTHNDLKLNNILLHNDWQLSNIFNDGIIRLIDWERSAWGDPAFDLGTLIASYLQIWLSSLVVSKAIEIEEALRLAMTPLEHLQPSIAALTKAYFAHFPEILQHRPDFLKRAVQFAGLALIQQIQAMIQYQKSFGNTGICMLQVAKSLLCRPEQSILTVFGTTESEPTSYADSRV